MSKKLYISDSLDYTPTQMMLMSEFCVFCMQNLPVKGDVKIMVVDDREKHGISTTGVYHLGRGMLKVYGRNRALADVLRSIAHELTHMMQDETGLIQGPVQDAGGFHENQANARAGEIIKLFAKSTPERKRIYEAYAS